MWFGLENSIGYIRAIKNNEGNWEIEPEAIDDWISLRRSPDRKSPDMTDGQQAATYADNPETLIRLAVAEARLQDMTTERDRLAGLLEKALEQRSRGIIARIFGQ